MRYLICDGGWQHLDSMDTMWLFRWVWDTQEDRLVAIEVVRDAACFEPIPWRHVNDLRDALEDIEGNLEMTLDDWGLAQSDTLPEWATTKRARVTQQEFDEARVW